MIASLPELTELHFGDTSKIECLGIGRLDLGCFVEILNRLLVILHILIDQTTTLVNQSIITDGIEDFGEALKSRCQLPTLVLHQTQMIEAGNVIVGYLKCFLEHIDGFLILLGVLIGETFAMEELSIRRHQPDSVIEILMCKINLLQC